MGSVYRGQHVLMDKTVAVKVLRPSLAGDDAVVARFSREAKAASQHFASARSQRHRFWRS